MMYLRRLLKYRIQITNIILVILLGTLPLLSQSYVPQLFYLIVAMPVLFAIVSYIARDYFDVILAGGIAGVFILARILFPNVDTLALIYRTAAFLAFFLLHVVLLIGPWSRFSKFIRKQYKHRRHLGVSVFYLGALHGVLLFQNYFGLSITGALQAIFVFFGFTALYIFSLLGITSWDWVQKHVKEKQWYIIHTVILLIYAVFIYLFFKEQSALGNISQEHISIYLPIAFLIFGLLVAPYSLVKLFFFKIMGWKQLHVLIYVAYISLLVHIWSGVEYIGVLWTRGLFIISAAVILLSHAYGWYIKWQEDKYFRARVIKVNRKKIVDGKEFVGIATTQVFTAGKGEKFIVNNIPIAAFLFKGNYFAVSNLCGHQKGPLYQGILSAAGYIICPWHQYSYSVKDGSGPAGFHDCIPHYPTLVEGNIVYVNVS